MYRLMYMTRMENQLNKLHKHIAKGLGNHDISPAGMAYKMLDESRYVNESLMQYMVNYIIIMATHPLIPLHLTEVHQECKAIYNSLQELGLTGTVGREVTRCNEYLAV